MNINWKARLTNKTWWIGIIGTIVLLSQQCGLDLSKYVPTNYVDIINTIFIILTMLGITVDTSTRGISDVTKNATTIQTANTEEKVQTTASTIEVNNTVDVNSASAKIEVDNPDNVQAIGATVNHTSAAMPQ